MSAFSVAEHLRQLADLPHQVPAAKSGTIDFNNPVKVTTFTASGAATLQSTLAVTGPATLSSTLAVTGAITATGGIVRTKAKQLGARPKTGTTAGWTVAAGNNLGTLATVAASQTSATLVRSEEHTSELQSHS